LDDEGEEDGDIGNNEANETGIEEGEADSVDLLALLLLLFVFGLDGGSQGNRAKFENARVILAEEGSE